ncbi:MAG: hypothetical protein OEZ68_12305 [Gammaproteobacteria bacterium]|nr:hypothetical protein [Gammaproteobacteria bacterium]MDH5801577.1 hypothetical protein [Gammaproteobacteria bacterium]
MKKENKTEPMTIHPDVGSMLEPASQFPGKNDLRNTADFQTAVLRLENTDYESEKWTSAYAVRPKGKEPFLLVNYSKERIVKQWSATESQLQSTSQKEYTINDYTPEKIEPLSGLRSEHWRRFRIVDAMVLTETQILFVFEIWKTNPSYVSYLYNSTSREFHPISPEDIAPISVIDGVYVRTHHLSADTVLVQHESNRVRLAAESYRNYSSHLVLVSPYYPQGIEFLQLGIDLGTIQRLSLSGNELYLELLGKTPPSSISHLNITKLLKK